MVRASARFADAFCQTWLRIPEEDQVVINGFLLRCPGFVHLCIAMDFESLPEEPWGRCSLCGSNVVFTFLAPFVERADPLEAVIAVIGHELAHCFNRASGKWNADPAHEEPNARQLTARWGFQEPGGYAPEWKQAIEDWRRFHQLEFGAATEKRLFSES